MFLRNQDGFPSWGRQHSLGVLPTCLLTTYGWCRQWLARILWWLGEKKVLTPETNVLNVHLCRLYTLLKGVRGTSSGTWWLCFQQSHRPPKPLFAYISFNKQCCVSIGKWLAVFDQCIFIRRKAIQWTQSLATWRLWAKFKNLTCKWYHVVTKCHSVGGDISMGFAYFDIFRKWHETPTVVGVSQKSLDETCINDI